jgi:tetratricopeptide (TPR) repeat protein
VVTREELRAQLWPADTFVEFDDNLNHAVNKLRQVLGDSAENPQFIETLPRKGYRFVAPVEPQDPNSAAAHQWYSALLSEIGRSEEAIDEIKKAYELDPISLRVGVDFGRAYYWARHYDEAIEQYHKVLELDPNYSGAHSMLGLALLEKREYEQAVAELQKGVALIPGNKEGYSIWLGYAYAVAGKRNEAQSMLATQVAHHARTQAGAQGIALTYVGLGDKDQAFNWLATAYRERDAVAMLKAYPF